MTSETQIEKRRSSSENDDTNNKSDSSTSVDGFDDVELGDALHKTTPSKRTKPFIVLVAACAALGGLIFGYDIAGAGATFLVSTTPR